jgi:hypothetical protein
MARITPSATQPTGLPAASQNLLGIPRPDMSIVGGARGGVYPQDHPGTSVAEKLHSCRRPSGPIGPATSTSPLGQNR